MNYRRLLGMAAIAVGVIGTTSIASAQQGNLWTNVYRGEVSTEKRLSVVTRDGSGNVYVGGYMSTLTSNTDILVLKYGPDGNLSSTWPDVGYGVGVRRYNGVGNDRDYVADMTTDAAGNLYVAGMLGLSGNAFNAPDNDACVLKYDPNGNLTMTIRLTPAYSDTAVAIHVAPSGRIYLLARSTVQLNGLLRGYLYLYEPNGLRSNAWPYIPDPTTGSNSTGFRELSVEPQAFHVTADGEVYVFGRRNPYMTHVDLELAMTKLSADGTRLWTTHHAGAVAGADLAVGLAVAPDGDLIALGNAPGNGTGPDFLLWRVKPDGTPSSSWPDQGQGAGVRRFDATGRLDLARALKVDPLGNVYVTGHATIPPYGTDGVAWKLDAQGNPSAEWADEGLGQGFRLLRGAGVSPDELSDVGFDGEGNVFVTGRVGISGVSGQDAVTIAYARTGEQLWKTTLSVATNSVDYGLKLLVDAQRGIFVAGTTMFNSPIDLFTVKYFHNTAPVANPTSASLSEDGSALISLSGYDREGDAFSATVNTLPANGSLSLSGADIVYSPALNFNGTDSFAFVLSDSYATSAPAAVQLNVAPVNDAPVVPPGTIYGQPLEDSPYTLTFDMLVAGLQATDVDGDALFIMVQRVDGGTLTKSGVPVAAGTLVFPGESLVWRAATNVYGGFLPGYSISAYDGELVSATSTEIRMNVIGVNDAPSFALSSSSYTLPKNANATTITGLATSISAGPANESSQAVTFQLTNSNAAFFSVQPALAANGTLTFTPKKGTKGQAVLTIVAKDNGGTANGGVDTSTARTFTIIAK